MFYKLIAFWSSLKGSTLPLSTPYYNASVPIWHDALPASKSELQKWEEDWREDPARDVVRAVGAWILVVKTPVGEEEGLVCFNSLFQHLVIFWNQELFHISGSEFRIQGDI